MQGFLAATLSKSPIPPPKTYSCRTLLEKLTCCLVVFAWAEWRLVVESTPHENTCIYSSAYDGGDLLTKFEENAKETATGGEPPTRSEGEYAATDNPWPRDGEKEKRDVAELHKRKPCPTRREGNRWDQYGESSSAASSEAHGMSDSMYTESTWGPCESASKFGRAAQPYRLQKANRFNRSDGQWSRWASDVRQSQPDQWSDSSAKWISSAGDDSSWRRASEWEGSQCSAPTKWTLKGSDYETDREWHSRNMKYGEGWAHDSTRSHHKRAKPTGTLKMIERQIQHCLLGQHPRRTIHKVTALPGRERTVIRIGGILPRQEGMGSQDCDMKEIFQVWQEIPPMPVLLLIASKASMRVKETQ